MSQTPTFNFYGMARYRENNVRPIHHHARGVIEMAMSDVALKWAASRRGVMSIPSNSTAQERIIWPHYWPVWRRRTSK